MIPASVWECNKPQLAPGHGTPIATVLWSTEVHLFLAHLSNHSETTVHIILYKYLRALWAIYAVYSGAQPCKQKPRTITQQWIVGKALYTLSILSGWRALFPQLVWDHKTFKYACLFITIYSDLTPLFWMMPSIDKAAPSHACKEADYVLMHAYLIWCSWSRLANENKFQRNATILYRHYHTWPL